jgi:2-polyprenyl-6-methoxyphenol hydroxylase-like FAD-dependent oxidoreductase
MGAANEVLIVGAGAAGCAAAVLLARAGVEVDLVELKDDITTAGSGITMQGNALRILRELGVWDQVQDHGYPFTTLGMRTPDGHLLFEIEDVRTGGPDLPATVGMERPALARVLVDEAVAAGAKLRFGTTVTALTEDADQVAVTFSDGSEGRYDLVVGADGVRSEVRAMIGIATGPEPTGMGIWRVFTSRPPSITRTDLAYGGACYIAGFCPTAEDSIYAYLVEPAQDRSGMSAEDQLDHMRALAANYGGPWEEIRERMTDPDTVHYTHFESHLLPAPWHRGRVVLIGDAAHSCPPTLAQGAALALEDAAVLAAELGAHDDLEAALTAFVTRRHDRVETVVAASLQLGTWLMNGDQDADVPGLIGRTLGRVSEPA